MRFYKPYCGEVIIDGHDLDCLDISWIRNNITLVQQQSVLFNETILKNIAFGRSDYHHVRRENVSQCIDLAVLQDTIREMPHGLETLVGTGGNSLSGGQRQRIAIARARLRDAPVLILDEATSALDYLSRTAIMEAIRKWRNGKTTIIITHDMSQIKEDDFLYVLENGRVIEEGYRYKLTLRDQDLSSLVLSPRLPENVRPTDQSRRGLSLSLDEPYSPVYSQGLSPTTQPLIDVFDTAPNNSLRMSSRKPSLSMLSPLSLSTTRRSSISADQSVTSRPVEKCHKERMLYSPRLSVLSPPGSRAILQAPGRRVRVDRSTRLNQNQLLIRRSIRNSQGRRSRKSSFRADRFSVAQRQKLGQVLSVRKVLLTVWPNLSPSHRIILVVGFGCALAHAACPPLFSWIFTQLLQTFYQTDHASQNALRWSMAILGIAVGDGVASFFMHYLLEVCGQSWVDRLRGEAMTRIVNQPKEWFEKEQNGLSNLTSCLDRNAEEMRNLVGRFAAFIFVAVTMLLTAIIWSLVVCWEVTLVGLSCGPFMYLLTKALQATSSKWENRTNEAGEAAATIFTETFADIKTVRSLTLESYFHKKFNRATSRAITIGFKRAVYTGLLYGGSDSMIFFVTGVYLLP